MKIVAIARKSRALTRLIKAYNEGAKQPLPPFFASCPSDAVSAEQYATQVIPSLGKLMRANYVVKTDDGRWRQVWAYQFRAELLFAIVLKCANHELPPLLVTALRSLPTESSLGSRATLNMYRAFVVTQVVTGQPLKDLLMSPVKQFSNRDLEWDFETREAQPYLPLRVQRALSQPTEGI